MNDRKKVKIFLIVIAGWVLFCFIAIKIGNIILTNLHHEEIHRVIQFHDGEVLEIKKVSVEESPFEKSSASNVIYKIESLKYDELKIAWYRGTKTLNDIHRNSTRRGGQPEKWILEE